MRKEDRHLLHAYILCLTWMSPSPKRFKKLGAAASRGRGNAKAKKAFVCLGARARGRMTSKGTNKRWREK